MYNLVLQQRICRRGEGRDKGDGKMGGKATLSYYLSLRVCEV